MKRLTSLFRTTKPKSDDVAKLSITIYDVARNSESVSEIPALEPEYLKSLLDITRRRRFSPVGEPSCPAIPELDLTQLSHMARLESEVFAIESGRRRTSARKRRLSEVKQLTDEQFAAWLDEFIESIG